MTHSTKIYSRMTMLVGILTSLGLASCANDATQNLKPTNLNKDQAIEQTALKENLKNPYPQDVYGENKVSLELRTALTEMRKKLVAQIGTISEAGINNALANLTDPQLTTTNKDGQKVYAIGDRLDNLDSGLLYARMKDVLALAKGYASDRKKYAYLLPLINDCLQQIETKYYYVGAPELGNWWTYEIGGPKTVLQIVAVLYNDLKPEFRASLIADTKYFQPDPYYSGAASGAVYSSSPDYRESTGGNRADTALVSLYRGILDYNPYEVQRALNSVYNTAQYVDRNDGWHRDGSFIQHTVTGYNGTYGSVYIEGLKNFKSLVVKPFAFSNPAMDSLITHLSDYYSPLFVGDRITDAVSGRAVYRVNGAYFTKPESDTLKIPYNRAATSSDLERGVALKSLLSQLGVNIKPSDENKYYYAMDKLVARNAQQGVVIVSMHSSRIANYETINGDNPYGLYENDGTTWIYGKNPTDFVGYQLDADPLYFPGITASKTAPLKMYQGEKRYLGQLSAHSFVGGINSADNVQFVAFDSLSWDKRLSVQKSYIANQDGVVVYGYTNSKLGRDLYTVIDQRRLENYELANSKVVPDYDKDVAKGKTLKQALNDYVTAKEKVNPNPAQVYVDGVAITKSVYFPKAPKELYFVDSKGTKIGYALYNMPNLEIKFENGFVRFVSYNTTKFSYGIYPQTLANPGYDVETVLLNGQEQIFFDPNNHKTYMNFFTKAVHNYDGLTVYGAAQAVKYTNDKGELVLELNDPSQNAIRPIEFKVDGDYELVSADTAVYSYNHGEDKDTTFFVDLNTYGKSVTLVLRKVPKPEPAKATTTPAKAEATPVVNKK